MKERKENYEYLKQHLTKLLETYNERILETKNNKISMACTLATLNAKVFTPHGVSPTFFGSYLFSRRVSGIRVVALSPNPSKINTENFKNYGSHSEAYPHLPYFTAAASIGQSKLEIDVFIQRLDEAFKYFYKQDAR